MTATTTRPATSEAVGFYGHALPIVEDLCAQARAWRDRAPIDPEAIRAHSDMTWLALRCELRLARATGGTE
jgi:hypothetical protein